MSSPVANARTSTSRGRLSARVLPTPSSVVLVASVRSGDRPTNGMEAARGALVGGGVAGARSGARAAMVFSGGAGSLVGGAGAPKGAGLIVMTSPVSVPVPGAGDLPFDFRRSVTVIAGSCPPNSAGGGAVSGIGWPSLRKGIASRRLSIGPGGGTGSATAGRAASWRLSQAATVGPWANADTAPTPRTARATLLTAARDVGITDFLSTGIAAPP